MTDRITPLITDQKSDPMPEARTTSKVITEIGSDCSNNHNFDDECGSNVIKVFAITPLSKRELLTCPRVEVNVGNKIVKALIDSGSKCNLINAELLQLVDEGLEMLSLPISGCIIQGAFQSRAQRIRSQVFVDLYIHGIRYETILLVAPTLTMPVILGMQFLRSYCVSINFEEGYFEAKVNEEREKHVYLKTANQEGIVMSTRTAEFPLGVEQGCKEALTGFYDEPTHITEMFTGFSQYHEVCGDGEKLGHNNSEKCGLSGYEGDRGSHSENVRDNSKNNERLYANCATINIESVEDTEFIGGEECEESRQIALYRCSVDVSPRAGDLFHAQRSGADKLKMSYMQRETSSNHDVMRPDPRDISVAELKQKTAEAGSLTSMQQLELLQILLKYKDSFSARPGKCRDFEYSFEVDDRQDIVGTSRLIPFKLRHEVREQIQQILTDGIIEHSNSSYINPLTIVPRPGKAPRICLDARRVNRHMTPDRTKIPPIQELIQRFYGAKFITSIDFSSAFLQVGLNQDCRTFTAFIFESEVYQFTRIPFGLKKIVCLASSGH
jgi:hypothetical protein